MLSQWTNRAKKLPPTRKERIAELEKACNDSEAQLLDQAHQIVALEAEVARLTEELTKEREACATLDIGPIPAAGSILELALGGEFLEVARVFLALPGAGEAKGLAGVSTTNDVGSNNVGPFDSFDVSMIRHLGPMFC